MKLLILLPFLFSCLQFEGQVEVSNDISPPKNSPPTFTTPAGTMDTRDFYTLDVSSIYKSRDGIKSATIYSRKGGVKIKLNANDLRNKQKLKIRKFNDQYLVRIRDEVSEEVISLESSPDGTLTL
jgi:hypothetical protein